MRALIGALALAAALPATADLASSANDNRAYLDNGTVKINQSAPDNIAILDLSVTPPKVLATLDVPTSVVGPPVSVAITRAAPEATSIAMSRRLAKKPIVRLSGDQNGLRAPVMPRNGSASSRSIARTTNSPWPATYTTRVPSGEIAS